MKKLLTELDPAQWGNVETFDNQYAKILSTSLSGEFPVCVEFKDKDGKIHSASIRADGTWHKKDKPFVRVKPEKIVWTKMFASTNGSGTLRSKLYATKEEMEKNAPEGAFPVVAIVGNQPIGKSL